MCYKDRWFCGCKCCVHWDICDRAHTDKVKEEAKKEGLLVQVVDGKPKCYSKLGGIYEHLTN